MLKPTEQVEIDMKLIHRRLHSLYEMACLTSYKSADQLKIEIEQALDSVERTVKESAMDLAKVAAATVVG